MLAFFRKYQKILFVLITVVIVITFSFFGTYKAVEGVSADKSIAFVATNGEKISQGTLKDLVKFVSSDVYDRSFSQQNWGVNGLNDGVVPKDFIDTGLAEMLIKEYKDEIFKDWEAKEIKERSYKTYEHPAAPFISTSNIWSIFVPNMSSSLRVLQEDKNIMSTRSIRARFNLFVGERMFTPRHLRQALLSQEAQLSKLPHDNNIDHADLALFGYHSAKDWFGPRFMDIVGEFIINASIEAEENGYKVTKEEAVSDLIINNDRYLRSIYPEEDLKHVNKEEFLNKQLNIIGMDLSSAAQVWRKVMLFRRILQDGGESILVDTLPYRKFHEYANKTYTIDLYSMPSEFQFNSFKDLQRFEVYMQALTQDTSKPKISMDVPQKILPLDNIKKNYPELVQKRYLVKVASAYKHDLEKKIGVKELLDWQLSDDNWDPLVNSFPILAVKSNDTSSRRFQILEDLSPVLREQVDQYSQNKIIGHHPEWIDEMLELSESKLQVLSLSLEGEGFEVNTRKGFIKLLDQTAFENEATDDKIALSAKKSLERFTSDGDCYYKISVLNRSVEEELLSYYKAARDGILDALLEKRLNQYYYDSRYKKSDRYKNDNGEWLAFEAVRELVAEDMFSQLLNEIQEGAPAEDKTLKYAVEQRFSSYLNGIMKRISNDVDESGLVNLTPIAENVYNNSSVSLGSDLVKEWEVEDYINEEDLRLEDVSQPFVALLPDGKDIASQWKPIKSRYYIKRGDSKVLDSQEVFVLQACSWSSIVNSSNGQPVFFFVDEVAQSEDDFKDRVDMGHRIIAQDAKRFIARQLLHVMKDAGSIDVSYFNKESE